MAVDPNQMPVDPSQFGQEDLTPVPRGGTSGIGAGGTGLGVNPGLPQTQDPNQPNTDFDPKAIIDAYIKAQQAALANQKPVNPELTAGEDLYFQIWGVKPPKGYIHALIQDGLNVYEIAEHEMSKPAFSRTRMYRDNYAGFAEQLASLMGSR